LISKLVNPMRIRWIGIALIVFSLLGTAIITQFLIRNEQKYATKDLMSMGKYITSLIALYSVEDFKGKKQDTFIRTFRQYLFPEKLLYCLVHDIEGRPLLELAPPGLPSAIPKDIQMRSLQSMVLTTQTFNLKRLKYPIYEYAKPIFSGGQRTGTVRLGFKASPVSLVSPDRLSMVAMIAFFIFATGLFVYYGLAFSLRPLKNWYQTLEIGASASNPDSPEPKKSPGFLPIVKGLEQSFFQIKEILEETKSEHAVIAGRLGAAIFEKNKIAKIIDFIDFGIIITDIQDHVTFINAYMVNLLNKDKEELLNRSLNEILTLESIQSLISHQDSLKTTAAFRQIETELPEFAPGEIFQVSLSYLKDNMGTVNSKMISVRNISQQKSTSKAQHDFIANVSHEFLTPLTTINSYTEMLIDEEVSDREMQKEFYNTISQEVGRLGNMIQNLLNMSKIEMGGLTLETNPVKTDWLVMDCLTAVEKLAQEKHITINKKLPDNYPTLIGDKELLKTAIINLLGNAVKYTPENGEITFSLAEAEEKVIFEVTDTGYGVSEEELPQIFDKFFRSQNPSIQGEKGTGLGLAMTSEIIQLHDGKIEVQSELDKGTQFTVKLPREDIYLAE